MRFDDGPTKYEIVTEQRDALEHEADELRDQHAMDAAGIESLERQLASAIAGRERAQAEAAASLAGLRWVYDNLYTFVDGEGPISHWRLDTTDYGRLERFLYNEKDEERESVGASLLAVVEAAKTFARAWESDKTSARVEIVAQLDDATVLAFTELLAAVKGQAKGA